MNFALYVVEIAIVLFVAYAGYALGESDLRIHPALTVVTVVVAVILHGVWQLALPHEQIEWIAWTVVTREPQSPTVVTIAVVETAGIWIPVLVIRWAALRTRIWAAAYIVGAAAIGAFAYYPPSFDPPPGPHPEYELWLQLALAVATIPFAIGCIVKRKPRGIASQQTPHAATDG